MDGKGGVGGGGASINIGGIAPNQVIARSEFEVHLQMFTERMVHICDSGDLCRYFDIYPMYSVAFVVW